MGAYYEGSTHDGALSPYHRLHADMSPDELRAFLLSLYEYGNHRGNPLQDVITDLLQSDCEVLQGGIVVTHGSFQLIPGCCCGLENWREWQGLEKDRSTPWLGHDPEPWIDASGKKAVLHNGNTEKEEFIEVSYAELAAGVEKVSHDLSGFLESLRAWLKSVDAENSERLCYRISQWFKIDPVNTWPEEIFDDIDWKEEYQKHI